MDINDCVLYKPPFSFHFDHDPTNGYYVAVRYDTKVNRENPYNYRLTLMWIDGNGSQLAEQVDNMIEIELNKDRRIIVSGVDNVWC